VAEVKRSCHAEKTSGRVFTVHDRLSNRLELSTNGRGVSHLMSHFDCSVELHRGFLSTLYFSFFACIME
jgi:hypothetical protein